MSRTRIIIALALIYMLFAVLLNSVGTVILQSIVTFGVDKPRASLLEACKDLTIAGFSFVVASFLPALGYKRAMMLSLVIVVGACMLMPMYPAFHTTELLFVSVGASFAMTKVAVSITRRSRCPRSSPCGAAARRSAPLPSRARRPTATRMTMMRWRC